MQRAAVGETLAHIVLLENHGRVRREGWPPSHVLPARPALRTPALRASIAAHADAVTGGVTARR